MATATQKIVILADDKTGAAISSAIRNSQKLDKQIKRSGDAMRTSTRQSRAHMAQLGHQVQDVAVQFQMGMNPLMILGQQGSQIASIFGTSGALFGGLLAIAAVVASQLVPALFEANEEFDKLLERASGVADDLKAEFPLIYAEAVERQTQAVADSEKAFKDAKIAVQEAEEAVARLGAAHTKTRGGVNQGRAAQVNANKALEDAKAARNSAVVTMIQERKELEKLTASTDEATESKKSLTKETISLSHAMRQEISMEQKRIDMLLQARSPQEKFNDGLAEVRKILGDPKTPDEVEAYRIQVEKLAKAYFPVPNIVDEVTTAVEENKKVIEEYGMTIQNVEKNAIGSLEDGLVGLVSGTKSASDAFKDMARSIINDMIRMQIQQSITGPLMNAINAGGLNVGTAMSYGTNVGSQQTSMIAAQNAGLRAMGGPVSNRKPYIVGERGPELMIPNGSGRVVSNDSLGGGGSPVNVTLNITTGVSQTVRAEVMNMLPQITNATKAAVAQERQRGGSFSAAMGT